MSKFTDIFVEFQKYLDAEQKTVEGIKKIVQDIDAIARQILYALQVIHHDLSAESTACATARELFGKAREQYGLLAASFPPAEYYRYHDLWKYATQRLCFGAALVVWLEVGTLITRETAAQILGIGEKEGQGAFHLDIEDFLVGLLDLVSELVRLAVNSVTLGEYARPIQISRFVADVNACFRLLTLKNDGLRRRFDVLKYDVKKIEDIVYDLGLRNMIPKPQE